VLNEISRMSRIHKIKKYAYDVNKIASIDPYNFNNVFILENNIIKEKTYDFALHIITLYKFLVKNNEFVISKQILKI
jgi:hypothetical protein